MSEEDVMDARERYAALGWVRAMKESLSTACGEFYGGYHEALDHVIEGIAARSYVGVEFEGNLAVAWNELLHKGLLSNQPRARMIAWVSNQRERKLPVTFEGPLRDGYRVGLHDIVRDLSQGRHLPT